MEKNKNITINKKEPKNCKLYKTLILMYAALLAGIGIATMVICIIKGRLYGSYSYVQKNQYYQDKYASFYLAGLLIGAYYFLCSINTQTLESLKIWRRTSSLEQAKIIFYTNVFVNTLFVLPIFLNLLCLKYLNSLQKENFEDQEKLDKYYNGEKYYGKSNSSISSIVVLSATLIIIFVEVIAFCIILDEDNNKFRFSSNFIANTLLVPLYFYLNPLVSAKIIAFSNVFLNDKNKVNIKWLIWSQIPTFGLLVIYFYYRKKTKHLDTKAEKIKMLDNEEVET
ncbi:hypothetical protein [Spiroplasma helicoides]|nr:hypothetical protein [Spiroplasma helicoides]